jgi:hypothetical protein
MNFLSLPINNANLPSYWISIHIFGISLIYLFLSLMNIPQYAYVLFPLIITHYIVGIKIKTLPIKIYKYSNKILELISNSCMRYILFVLFLCVVVPLSRFGNSLAIKRVKTESMWENKHSDSTKGTNRRDGSPNNKQTTGNWISSYLRWCIDSRAWHMICIFPYMLLVRLYGHDHDSLSVPENTYTLY